MSDTLFRNVVVPVASEQDAAASMQALAPFVQSSGERVVAVHVVEKAGGAIDKASVEQRELQAEAIFDVVRERLADADVAVETKTLYGTDVAETIIDAAHDTDASAIVFTPRGGSRWLRLLTGDVALDLVTGSDLPVVVLPDVSTEDTDR